MGAINFSQIMGLETAEDSIGIKSVYESLIFINLLFSEVEELKDVVYEDFSFVALQDTVNLQFYALNYNPILGNLNNALYELINPNGETIASGELADSVLLTPLTKSRMQIPLIDNSELIEGEYRLTIETSRKAITTLFLMRKKTWMTSKRKHSHKYCHYSVRQSIVYLDHPNSLSSTYSGSHIYSEIKKEKERASSSLLCCFCLFHCSSIIDSFLFKVMLRISSPKWDKKNHSYQISGFS